MATERQPYLKGFSPKEVPFKGSEHLTVTKEYGDYYVNLTEEGILKACTVKRPFDILTFPTVYEPISTEIETDEPNREVLELNATRDSLILWDGFKHQDMVIKRDQEGLVVFVYTPRLAALLDGSLPFLMTRYDGHTDKIWIRKQE